MKLQNYEIESLRIRREFRAIKAKSPEKFERRLNLSWSNWGFGREFLATSAQRLQNNNIRYVELQGNHYGADLGYPVKDTLAVLSDHNLQVAGICGMFSAETDLSSPSGVVRQRAVDYLKRTLEFASSVKAGYVLVVPGAVGRPQPYDESELERSAETLRLVADYFVRHKVFVAVEPIRSAEVSFCHTIADAHRYIAAVDHPGVQHINADVYHMQTEESHIGSAILRAGEQLINLHLADSNRGALGDGSLDIDTIIMALYLIGYNRPGCYITPEPLGPGGDPYPSMHGRHDPVALDRLVHQTVRYFREREEEVLFL
ncbi:MAG: sugar phosphate isomerase/epimerase family protein [Phycisphaerae bacterium]